MFSTNLKFLSIVFALIFAIGFTSCTETETDEVVDSSDFSEATVNKMRGGDRDCKGCFELVYPVTIKFADDTTAEVTDRANLKETIKAWFQTTGTEKREANRPTFVFPISVTIDGEVVQVANEAAFKELAESCKGQGGKKGGKKGGKGGHGGPKCYAPVFPISFNIGGTVTEFNSHEELRAAIKKYVEENGKDAARPEVVFPAKFQNKDTEEVVTVQSLEELKELEESCEGGRKGHGQRCYAPVFPISFNIGGTVTEFNSHEELRAAMKKYREENGRNAARPEVVFPAKFQKKDTEEVVTVQSLEELKELEESCD